MITCRYCTKYRVRSRVRCDHCCGWRDPSRRRAKMHDKVKASKEKSNGESADHQG